MNKRNGCRGVTLIELFFALAVLAVLAGLAAPGFRTALRTAAIRSATFELLAGLQQTRGNAIVEARPGLWCLADAAGACLQQPAPAAFWSSFLDVNGSLAPLAHGQLPAGVMVHASRNPLRFWPGSQAASTGTLTICDVQGVAPPRAIVINISGRARVMEPGGDACGAL